SQRVSPRQLVVPLVGHHQNAQAGGSGSTGERNWWIAQSSGRRAWQRQRIARDESATCGRPGTSWVRERGLEPLRPKTPDPKSGASAIPPLPRAPVSVTCGVRVAGTARTPLNHVGVSVDPEVPAELGDGGGGPYVGHVRH